MKEGVLRVLVIDDSAYVRKVVREILSRSPFIEVVGAARDGREGLELTEQLNPDVVTCDLQMPELDGVGFVREQMRRKPLPIIIMSIADENADAALNALESGAVDFVQKPTALATEKIFEVSIELIDKVKAAGNIPVERIQSAISPGSRYTSRRQRRTKRGGRGKSFRRHRGSGYLHGRTAGTEAAYSKPSRRLSRTRYRGHAHARWLHGNICTKT